MKNITLVMLLVAALTSFTACGTNYEEQIAELLSENEELRQELAQSRSETNVFKQQLADAQLVENSFQEESYETVETVSERPHWMEVFEYTTEITPFLEYYPYYHYLFKCIATVHQRSWSGNYVTWDIWLFVDSGVLGTWIVNCSGNTIEIWGHTVSNISFPSISLGYRVWVRPSGFFGDNFQIKF